MNFNQKIIITALFLLFGIPTAIFFVHRIEVMRRPKPAPIQPRAEKTITIIPGWNLRDVAEYLVKMGFASTTGDVYALTGKPAVTLPNEIETTNLEGMLAPETYRVYSDADLADVVMKLSNQRNKELSEIASSTTKSRPELLTMASLLEEEARTPEDRRLVSDILWRRLEKGWALQLDSTVHYAVNKKGNVFTTKQDREVKSPWNTYLYPGLPPTPICNPSVDSIEAALNPEKNDYWYFLTGNDGKMHYAKTLDEHNLNRAKYLK